MAASFNDIQVVQVLSGVHQSDINSVDVSSFGKEDLLVTGSSDQTVRLWKRLGTMVASGSTDGTAIITEPRTAQKLFTFVQPTTHSAIRVCRFSPDSSRLITTGDDETICIWDIRSRSLSLTIKYHEATIFAADFTSDSCYLISCDANGVICLWDCDSQNERPLVVVKEAHDLGVLSCDFAPLRNDEYLSNAYTLATGGNDDVIRLWKIYTGLKKHKIELIHTLSGHPGACVMSLRFSPIKGSNLLISTGGDKLARLWDTSGNKCIAVLNHHTRYVTSSVFLRHGQFLITGSNDRTAVIWDLNIDNSTTVLDQDYISCEKSINRRNEEIYQLLMNNEFLEATLEASLSGHHSDINNLIFISQNQLISCSSDKTVRHWYLSSSPDFSISKILVSGDGKIRHMSEEIEIIGSLPVEELFGVIRSCRITLDCKFVLSGGDDDRIYVWDVESLQKIESYEGHEGTIFFIDFVPFKDGVYRIVSGCAMGELKYWIFNPYGDQKSQTLTYVEEAHDLGVNCGAFRHQNESKCEDLSGHGGVIMSVSFSKGDSRQLMVSTSGDKTVRLWDGFDFQVLRVLETQCRYVPCSAFSQPLFELDGSKYMYLATGSNDEFISLWKLSGSLVDENIQSFHHTDMKKWSISDVSVWINSLKIKGFNSHIFSESFESLRLDGAQLAHLTREDLLSKFPETFSEPSAAENSPRLQVIPKFFPPSLVNDETEIPSDLICPITHEIMIHPVSCSDGFVYEKKTAIEEWLISRKRTSPMTNLIIHDVSLTFNRQIHRKIQDFLSKD
ncbi:unnamed protein product [Lepeophtheirus salmonis]|uniref:WD repeat, SAM and U-box domain-containing protein 1 n=1 Tax=Lepeophtheirus salmonis TaxID=72036 RepID=A0A7R8CFK9_LEPSM|nr:unnamed protein product [Lepeophtheirus salmonis]CAF2803198.1 unnamed protein product [Lepeophtheirus salmonis]